MLLYQLELGLEYNDFKLIKKSLKNLLAARQTQALQIILTDILRHYQKYTQFYENKSFYYGLIEMALLFLQTNIHTRILAFASALRGDLDIFLGKINLYDDTSSQFQ